MVLKEGKYRYEDIGLALNRKTTIEFLTTIKGSYLQLHDGFDKRLRGGWNVRMFPIHNVDSPTKVLEWYVLEWY